MNRIILNKSIFDSMLEAMHIKNKIFTHAVPVVVENLSEHLWISVEHVRLANRVIEQLFFWTS